MPSEIVVECCRLLKEQGLTIAFAESATAGRMAAEFSLTDDSGPVLTGGLVCYDARIKEYVLGIDPAFIRQFTPESLQVTAQLASRLGNLLQSSVQVAVTGLTTPGGSENEQKPVGTMFVHILLREKSIALRKVFVGTPEQIVLQAIDMAAERIVEELKLPLES